MPYEWLPPDGKTRRLHLWPYRSLSQRGFVLFIALTACLIALPALGALGTMALWGLLPFLILTIAGIWYALRKNARDREIIEQLDLSPIRIRLTRDGPDGHREWQADPYWVRIICHATDGPVPNYLTLRGGGREVEIGSFLTAEERLALQKDLIKALAELRLPEAVTPD